MPDYLSIKNWKPVCYYLEREQLLSEVVLSAESPYLEKEMTRQINIALEAARKMPEYLWWQVWPHEIQRQCR